MKLFLGLAILLMAQATASTGQVQALKLDQKGTCEFKTANTPNPFKKGATPNGGLILREFSQWEEIKQADTIEACFQAVLEIRRSQVDLQDQSWVLYRFSVGQKTVAKGRLSNRRP